MTKTRWFGYGMLVLAATTQLGGNCLPKADPPAEGLLILGIRVELPSGAAQRVLSGGGGETLDGLTTLQVDVVGVEVVHRAAPDDPFTEEVLALPDTAGTLTLLEGLDDVTPSQLLTLSVPVGHVVQVRLVVEAMTISFEDGASYAVKLPSGAQSGVKVEPDDGVPFAIIDGGRTGAQVVFRPFDQIIGNKGQGFIFKPVMTAEHVDMTVLTGSLANRVVASYAVFDPTASEYVPLRCPVETMRRHAAMIDAEVIGFDTTTNYFVFEYDAGVTEEEAFRHFLRKVISFEHTSPVFGLSFTREYWCRARFVLPDYPVAERTSQEPCDPVFEPNPYRAIGAPEAWDDVEGTRGDWRVAIAVVDSGFDLDYPDLADRWFINIGELPAGTPGSEPRPVRWVTPSQGYITDENPTIAVSQSVLFRNDSQESHQLSFPGADPIGDVELAPGQEILIDFDVSDVYTFSCAFHTQGEQGLTEHGQVRVEDSPAGSAFRFDRDGDGSVDSADIEQLESDAGIVQDGVLTIADLNVGAVQQLVCGAPDCLDRDGDGRVHATDLVEGVPFDHLMGEKGTSCERRGAPVGLEDGVDNDDNGFCDDLVGWDFANNDNVPEGGPNDHGTQMAEIIGGGGGPAVSGVCSEEHGVGMMWGGVRLLPVKPGSVPRCGADDACLGGRVCVGGLCLSCVDASECAAGLHCAETVDGRRCTPECEADTDCDAPYICLPPLFQPAGPRVCQVEDCSALGTCTRAGATCQAGQCMVLTTRFFAETTRSENVIGLRYAYGFEEVRVANLSRGLLLFKGPAADACRDQVAYVEEVGESLDLDLDGDGQRETNKWTTLGDWLTREMECVDSGGPNTVNGGCMGTPSGKLLVVAAGNCRLDLDPDSGDDDTYEWPAEFVDDHGGLVVGAIDERAVIGGARPSDDSVLFAFGDGDVDVLAPGWEFLHDRLTGAPDFLGGTSPAAAMTSGLLGLVMAKHPLADGEHSAAYRNRTRQRITDGTVRYDCLAEHSVHGVVNSCAAVRDRAACGLADGPQACAAETSP